MRKILISAVVAVSAIGTVPAHAQFIEGVLGAAAGAVLCSQLGNGNGNTLAIAACAVAGSKIAENMTRPKVRPPQEVDIRQSRGYDDRGRDYDQERNRVHSDFGGFRQPPVSVNGVIYESPPCDENYYEGQYNPGAARSFCQGQRVRYARDIQRQQQNAYNRGANGGY